MYYVCVYIYICIYRDLDILKLSTDAGITRRHAERSRPAKQVFLTWRRLPSCEFMHVPGKKKRPDSARRPGQPDDPGGQAGKATKITIG